MGRLKILRVEDQAERIGVSRAQLYLVISGGAPGEKFIAACVAAGGKFEELFEVVTEAAP
jgi:hypothetical protein